MDTDPNGTHFRSGPGGVWRCESAVGPSPLHNRPLKPGTRIGGGSPGGQIRHHPSSSEDSAVPDSEKSEIRTRGGPAGPVTFVPGAAAALCNKTPQHLVCIPSLLSCLLMFSFPASPLELE